MNSYHSLSHYLPPTVSLFCSETALSLYHTNPSSVSKETTVTMSNKHPYPSPAHVRSHFYHEHTHTAISITSTRTQPHVPLFHINHPLHTCSHDRIHIPDHASLASSKRQGKASNPVPTCVSSCTTKGKNALKLDGKEKIPKVTAPKVSARDKPAGAITSPNAVE